MKDWDLIWASEHAILVRAMDGSIPGPVAQQIGTQIQQTDPSSIRSVTPSSQGVLVGFDMTRVTQGQALDLLGTILTAAEHGQTEESDRLITIPACYDLSLAPDLEFVARHAGLDIGEIIELHSQREYRVEAVGFSPGFGYLRSIDERLRLPRRDEPRTRIPAGSVAIAEDMTGVYPSESAGGWHLIARTPIRMFDAQQDPPGVLRVGDRVRFKPIDLDAYRQLEREGQP